MAKVVTEFDVNLAMWQAKIAQIKADQNELVANAKAARLGQHMMGHSEGTIGQFRHHIGQLKGELIGAAAGAFSIEGIKGAIEEFAHFADVAKKLDVDTTSVQRLSHMAKLAGSDVDTVGSSLIKLQRQLAGSGKDVVLAGNFKEAGINVREFLALKPEQQIAELAAAQQRADATGRGVGSMFDILSKKAEGLLPILRQNKEELEKIAHTDFASLQAVEGAKKFEEAWSQEWQSFKAGAANAASSMHDFWAAAAQSGSFAVNLRKIADGHQEEAVAQEEANQAKREANVLNLEKEESDAKGLARIKRSFSEIEKGIALSKELNAARFEVGFKNLPDVGKLIAITRQIAEIKKNVTTGEDGKPDTVSQLKADIEITKLEVRGAEIGKQQRDQEKKLAAAGEEFQIQLKIDAAKVASGGIETAAINRLQDKLAAKRVALELEEKFKMTAAQSLSIANQQVTAARAAVNATKARERGQAAGDIKEELAVMELRARHNNKGADALEKQIKLQKDARAIGKQLGISPQDAMGIAKRHALLQDKIDNPGKIHGYTGPSGIGQGSRLADFYARQQHAAGQLSQQNNANAQAQNKDPVDLSDGDKILDFLGKIAASVEKFEVAE